MKSRTTTIVLTLAVSCILVLAALTSNACAATFQYFSYVAGTNTTWDTTSLDWSATSGGPYTQAWGGGDNLATFEGTVGGAVAVGTVSTGGLGFTANGYTLNGGTITTTIYHDVQLNNGANATIGSTLAGANGLDLYTYQQAGVLTLTGANTYSGVTTIHDSDAGAGFIGGVLNIQNSNALGDTAKGTVVLNGSTLELQDNSGTNISVGNESLTISGTGVSGSGALRNISGNNTYGGAITLGNSNVRINSDSGTLTLSNTTAISGSNSLTIGGSGNVSIASANLTGRSSGLTKDGSGTLTLTSTNGFVGGAGTTTINGGTLASSNDSIYLYSPILSGATLQSNGGDPAAHWSFFVRTTTGSPVLTVTGSAASTICDGSGSGNAFLVGNAIGGTATTFNVGDVTSGTDLTVSTALKDSASNNGLTKTGAGTMLLSGANTYTGATTISAGTLAVNSSIAASSGVSVSLNAILSGSGTVSAISGAGLVSPGNSPGILTASSINPSSGLGLAFELSQTGSPVYSSATASGNDVLHLTGATPISTALASANQVNVYLDVASLNAGDQFRGGVYEDVATNFLNMVNGATYNYYVLGDGSGTHAFNGVDYYTLAEYSARFTVGLSTVADTANFGGGPVSGGVMEFTLVPEPGTLVLLATGLLGLLVYAWRKCK